MIDEQRSWPPTRLHWWEKRPKAHIELKEEWYRMVGDKGHWDRQRAEGYSCLIACPTCRLDVSRCPIYSCSPSSFPRTSTGRLFLPFLFFFYLFSSLFLPFFSTGHFWLPGDLVDGTTKTTDRLLSLTLIPGRKLEPWLARLAIHDNEIVSSPSRSSHRFVRY